jgi:drug/metabolite transporter (DMT)-like permease
MAWSRALGFVSILVLLPVLRRSEDDAQPREGDGRSPRRAAVWAGALLGGLMFAGYALQTEGLARTTATNAAFITSLYVVLTPIQAAAVFGYRIRPAAWISVGISIAGLLLLSLRSLGTFRLHAGDLLVLAGAVAWAGHIVAVGHFSPKVPGRMLALSQMGFAAALQLVAAAPGGLHVGQALGSNVWPLLILTGVFGSGVAFTIQVLAQRTITATRAVVLLAGEALFAAAFSAIWIGERLAVHQWIGAVLVLAAMGYSELSARRPGEALLEPASAP